MFFSMGSLTFNDRSGRISIECTFIWITRSIILRLSESKYVYVFSFNLSTDVMWFLKNKFYIQFSLKRSSKNQIGVNLPFQQLFSYTVSRETRECKENHQSVTIYIEGTWPPQRWESKSQTSSVICTYCKYMQIQLPHNCSNTTANFNIYS